MLAARASNPEHKAMLGRMAETWENLAQQRERLVERRARIAALEEQGQVLRVMTMPAVATQPSDLGSSRRGSAKTAEN